MSQTKHKTHCCSRLRSRNGQGKGCQRQQSRAAGRPRTLSCWRLPSHTASRPPAQAPSPPGLPHGVAGPNLRNSHGTPCWDNPVTCLGLASAGRSDRSPPARTALPVAGAPTPGRGPSPRRAPGTNGAARRRLSSWLPAGDGAVVRAVVPAVVPAAAGGGAVPPAPGAGAGRRPGLGRRGLARLGHPDAAAGRAGGGRRAAGALLHAAAVHAVPQPAAQRPLPGRERRGCLVRRCL